MIDDKETIKKLKLLLSVTCEQLEELSLEDLPSRLKGGAAGTASGIRKLLTTFGENEIDQPANPDMANNDIFDMHLKMAKELKWALGELNMKPFEWSCDEDADMHCAALESICWADELEARMFGTGKGEESK